MIDLSETFGHYQMIFGQALGGLISNHERSHQKVSIEGLLFFLSIPTFL